MTIVIDTISAGMWRRSSKKKKRKIADRVRRKARVQKGHNVSSNFTHQRKERQRTKTKNLRSQG